MEKCDILDCSFNKAIDIIKSRFACAIITSISEGKSSFSEISNDFSYLTNATLSRALKKLCDDDLLIKEEKNYTLTPAGEDLTRIIDDLDDWYEKHFVK